jgi:uncharacterized protein (TIGR04141 family)
LTSSISPSKEHRFSFNLEPCGFFSNKKQFIHLKDGHSSGSISHLWSQGVVSAEAFLTDPDFRKKLRAKVRSLGGGFEAHLPKSNEKVVRDDFSVVYGIMRKPYADGSIGLPFFSKVSLRNSHSGAKAHHPATLRTHDLIGNAHEKPIPQSSDFGLHCVVQRGR